MSFSWENVVYFSEKNEAVVTEKAEKLEEWESHHSRGNQSSIGGCDYGCLAPQHRAWLKSDMWSWLDLWSIVKTQSSLAYTCSHPNCRVFYGQRS